MAGVVLGAGLVGLAGVAGCHRAPVAGAAARRAPDTPAARALAAWVAAYNTGSVDTLRAFAERTYAPTALARTPAAERAAEHGWVFVNVGPVEIVEVDSASGDTIVSAVVRQPRLGAWGRARVRVTSDSAHAIMGAGLTAYLEDAPPRFAPAPGPVDDAARVRDIVRTLDTLAAADAFSGVVLVARGDSVLLHRAYGFADRERRIRNQLDTRFELASVGKMFTGVAVARLVESGRLSFGDTLAALLPDYPNRDAARRITVHHLLTHSSGIPDYLLRDAYQAASAAGRVQQLTDVWPFFARDTLDFAPGTRAAYSNSNFALLGTIVERISGEPFAAFVRRHVFDRAGMRATWTADSQPGWRALGYTRFDGRGPDLTAWHAVPAARAVGAPAGGGVAPAGDLLRFARALLAHRLLGAAMTDSVLVGRVPSGPGERNGYGFDETTRRGVRYVGHNGGYMGTYNEVDIYVELGYVTVLLSNVDTMGSRAAAEAIRRALARR
jgi:CubicO group peptidase (beta-lactamase class C family)